MDSGGTYKYFGLVGLCLVLFLAYRVGIVVYNLYVHPLARVPGPRLYAASNIPYAWALIGGKWTYTLKDLHDKYGPVVRFAPDDVSFISAGAWKAIYGHRTGGEPNFEKDRRLYRGSKTDTRSILVAGDADHSRMRRSLAHAFSEKALRGQEDIMQGYIGLLVKRMREIASSSSSPTSPAAAVVDLAKWYNFTTFDLIGDLAFGEPFGCLQSGGYHPWVAMIFGGFKLSAFNQARKRFPWLMPLTQHFLPKRLLTQQGQHFQMSFDKAKGRAVSGVKDREDFMSYILRHNDERGLTPDEIGENSNILIVAGSETTASLLSGTTYYLLRNPDTYKRLVAEIRSSFDKESDINLVAVGNLKYLLACLDEGLRLYPPVPSALGRNVAAGGKEIEGFFIPENTTVSVPHWPAYHSEYNFHRADDFCPQRWLGDAEFANDNKDVLQPFQFGPRNCLGKSLAYAEMRLILARMLWNFDLELQPQSVGWEKQLIFNFWEKGPMYVKVIPRRLD
ncbi:uncharacterized protein A1O5_12297 [Cladophialophora psammophila CBS 110553]|uniref:Cytochrome P450 monooxygenase n=1 Tax=Cladophialophora psammophila CBS 110553 TaxID=1182543 RepID=W9W4F7_9EURO|nr:uncharacterized protein A1O5_12297 [Cladophialophora psammophila CBS 110553]EXJ59416.1 hypothetical protein A1O5_12297 [Cladophialophora psammophila CBS 110553]